jgi:multisubunit Na+/H+ antiporter MnhB subunit
LVYYALLFLLSNTHLLAALLATSIHACFLFSYIEEKKNMKTILLHALFGLIVLLPSLYFIFPPSTSEMNSHFWLEHWNVKELITIVQAPLRSFIPIPAWWIYNFWNTQFLLELQSKFTVLKFTNLLLSVTLIVVVLSVLKKSKKSLILFLTNVIISSVVGCVFSLTSARYAGFIFVSFIVSYWVYCYESFTEKNSKLIIKCLLFLQLIAGFFAVIKDIKLPFSNSYQVDELVKEVPSNKIITTDYWTLNTLSAYEDKAYYCLDLQRKLSFLLWKEDMFKILQNSGRYYNGINDLFRKERINQLYFISINSPVQLSKVDNLLFKKYSVQLIDKRDGAIEKGSNLYLYQITNREP